jgi:DMSO reductase anchor subunit
LGLRIWDLPRSHKVDPNLNPNRLFIFAVQRVATATTAELFELKPVRRVLFVLGRHVVALFAIRALQNNVVSSAFRHFLPLKTSFVFRPWSFANDEEPRTND